MVKKSIRMLLCALCCTTLLVSCGGSKSDSGKESSEAQKETTIKVRPESTSIGGKFGKAFSFEDKEYALKLENSYSSDYYVKLNITMTRNNVKPSVNFNEIAGSHDAGKKYVGDIEAEFLDENDDVVFTARVGLSNYTDIDKLLTLEEGDRTTVTFSSYESKATVNSAKKFRLTSTLENNRRAGKAGSEMDELNEAMQSLGEVTDAFGAMFDAASKTIDAANKLNK